MTILSNDVAQVILCEHCRGTLGICVLWHASSAPVAPMFHLVCERPWPSHDWRTYCLPLPRRRRSISAGINEKNHKMNITPPAPPHRRRPKREKNEKNENPTRNTENTKRENENQRESNEKENENKTRKFKNETSQNVRKPLVVFCFCRFENENKTRRREKRGKTRIQRDKTRT